METHENNFFKIVVTIAGSHHYVLKVHFTIARIEDTKGIEE